MPQNLATNKYAIIVAGGSGQRFAAQNSMMTSVPKQFLLLNGKPIIMHSISQFALADASTHIIVVLPEQQIEYYNQLCREYNFTIDLQIIKGGRTRTESVINGLQQVPDDALVAIHDGVRPLVSIDLINRCFAQAQKTDCAIPTMPSTDTLRHITGKLLDRNSVLLVQTPQVFNSTKLKQAYSQIGDSVFTDDASVYEQAGNPITLIEGERNNIKITTPTDLALANILQKIK